MICILGGGPCGLGAAYRLQEAGIQDFMLFEADSRLGGLARSFVDQQGFTWDIGGHVQFSHYEDFDRVMAEALPDGWYTHQRESWVWMRERFIPYPLQLNIQRLPPTERDHCLQGLEAREESKNPANFEEWLRASFGEGLFQSFMKPYNLKIWAHDLKKMDYRWIGERVATVDLERIRQNIAEDRDDLGWGPNSVFHFPKSGGTGAVWKAVGSLLAPEKIQLQHKAISIDPQKKEILFENGRRQKYSKLLSTLAIDQCFELAKLGKPERLLSSNSHIVGIGLEGELPKALHGKCWIYFPEASSPFYRATVFSNYSPAHVPDPKHHWSLMCETSESEEKPVNLDRLVEETISGLQQTGLIHSSQKIISRWLFSARPGYPTPFLGRDEQVQRMREKLESFEIYPRGRFGLWKYEASNQDHTFMQGFEWVDRILFGSEEETAETPQKVNSRPKTAKRPLGQNLVSPL